MEFIARNNLVEMPTRDFNTPRGRSSGLETRGHRIRLGRPAGEKRRPRSCDHCAGGAGRRARIATAGCPVLPVASTLVAAAGLSPGLSGFIDKANALAQFIGREAHETVPLAPGGKAQGPAMRGGKFWSTRKWQPTCDTSRFHRRLESSGTLDPERSGRAGSRIESCSWSRFSIGQSSQCFTTGVPRPQFLHVSPDTTCGSCPQHPTIGFRPG